MICHKYSKRLQAYIFRTQDSVSAGNGAPPGVDLNKLPKNFRDALRRIYAPEWTEAYRNEGQGFQDRDALEVVKQQKGAKVLDSITRAEYKQVTGVLQKQKVCWCIRGDQQEYYNDDRYSPVLKAPEVMLLMVIAAQHGCNLY